MRMAAVFTDGLRAQVCWIGLRVGSHEELSVHSSDKPCELSQWTLTCTINTTPVLLDRIALLCT